jgi:serine protease AprX
MASAVSPDGDDVELVGAGYLRVHAALGWMDLGLPQTWQPATGLGTLDGARGSVRVLRDGIVLEGEFDIFGSSWSGSRWTQDAWSGSRWTGSRWTEAAWTGSRWTGSGWSADVWTGPSWSGSRWTADIWSGSRWTGSRWTSDGFTGSRWTGSRWTAGGWFGVGWDDGPATETTAGAEPVTAEAVSAAAAS